MVKAGDIRPEFETEIKERIADHRNAAPNHVVKVREDKGYLPYVKLQCTTCSAETYVLKLEQASS